MARHHFDKRSNGKRLAKLLQVAEQWQQALTRAAPACGKQGRVSRAPVVHRWPQPRGARRRYQHRLPGGRQALLSSLRIIAPHAHRSVCRAGHQQAVVQLVELIGGQMGVGKGYAFGWEVVGLLRACSRRTRSAAKPAHQQRKLNAHTACATLWLVAHGCTAEFAHETDGMMSMHAPGTAPAPPPARGRPAPLPRLARRWWPRSLRSLHTDSSKSCRFNSK